jgi:tetratricopeptide (TPR) repeat protein
MGTRPYWVRGRYRNDRQRLIAGLGLPPLLATVDAHRRLRGPYTAAGSLLRAVVPSAARRRPTLVARHNVEILAAAPELRGRIPTGTGAAGPATGVDGGARLHPAERTLRIAHGLTDFLTELRRAEPGDPVTLVIENAHEADATDREFLAVLLRRLDPELVTLVVCTSPAPVLDDILGPALDRHAERTDVPRGDTPLWTEPAEAAIRYVNSDCTDDHPRAYAGYLALPPAKRALLHDERAAELAATGEQSLWLGALPLHLERGTNPSGSGVHRLTEALEQCVDLGYYAAAVDFAARLRALLDPRGQQDRWWAATCSMATALTALGRTEEAESLYDEVRAHSQDATVHLQAAYQTAMLYTHHHGPQRRNGVAARVWLNQAAAFASVLPVEPATFHDGMALVEVHEGDLPGALRLLDDGLAIVRQVSGRCALLQHRARVYARMDRLDDALADYDEVVRLDPGVAEHHHDRGMLLRRLGRLHEALDDYQQAIALSPPWAAAHYQRGDTLAELGDAAGALADFDYVLQLEPDHLEARMNRAGLLIQLGSHDEAEVDVDTGLDNDPTNPHLLCLRGQLLVERGQLSQADEAYSTAIALAPSLADAWALRGALHFETGELAEALHDLDRAAQLSGDPTMAFNRAAALQASGRLTEAIAAYDAVLAVSDDPDARLQRQICRAQLGAASVPRPR